MESSKCRRLESDQFLEIFSRMPAKELIQFSSLSKYLSSFLPEPLFIKKQSICSSLLDSGFFLQSATTTITKDKFKLEYFHVPQGESDSTFDINSLSFILQSNDFLGSSQGLVLRHRMVNGADELLFCNTATMTWMQFPLPEWLKPQLPCGDSGDHGLLVECKGLECFLHDYTVIVPTWIVNEENYWLSAYQLAVYRNGNWEEDTCDLTIKGRQPKLDMPVGLFRGHEGGLVVHYLCYSLPYASRRPVYLEPYMAAYDIQRKEFSRIFKLPEDAFKDEYDTAFSNKEEMKIFKLPEQTVGLVRTDERMISVWVLEDYERGLWRRVVSKTTSEMGAPEEEGGVIGCCIVNGMGFMFATGRRVYVYKMEGSDAGRVEVVSEHGFQEARSVAFNLYANTVRPACGGEWVIL